MTHAELVAIFDSASWTPLKKGVGAYNKVFISDRELSIDGYSGLWVYKQPLLQKTQSSAALSVNCRAVRKSRDLNPSIPAYIIRSGWIMPYLGDVPASDQQIAEKLVDIYRQTRNIIVDACGTKNFLVYRDEVVCVDVDQAFRRGSFDTDNYLNGGFLSSFSYNTYWGEYALFYKKPLTVSMIKTLLYLEEHLHPCEIKNEYITPAVLQVLDAFRRERRRVVTSAMLDQLVVQRLAQPSSIDDEDAQKQFVSMGVSIFKPVNLNNAQKTQAQDKSTSLSLK